MQEIFCTIQRNMRDLQETTVIHKVGTTKKNIIDTVYRFIFFLPKNTAKTRMTVIDSFYHINCYTLQCYIHIYSYMVDLLFVQVILVQPVFVQS